MTNPTPGDLPPGTLELTILKSLRRRPARGCMIVQQQSSNLLQVEEGQLYAALQRPFKAKPVKVAWGVSAADLAVGTCPLTAAGLRHLESRVQFRTYV